MIASDVIVGRQAIFDRAHEVMGYELLFRPVPQVQPPVGQVQLAAGDGDLMTSEVIFSAVSIGIGSLVGSKLAFINGDRGLLTGAVPVNLPPEQTVIEVLETVYIDDEVLAGCTALIAQGYRLALDDFVWFDGAERLLELAWLVKIDLRIVAADQLAALVSKCRRHDVELLAEKIETQQEYDRCVELGFDYFQGYALSRPRVIPGRALDMSVLGRARLAATLMSTEISFEELEEIVRTEPGMTFQLLQLASIGAKHGTRRSIRSVREALVLVGARRIQNWMALLVLARPGSTSTEDMELALSRARMCELLAETADPRKAAMAYTAGLLSTFDLLLGISKAEIVEHLPLDEALKRAAFDYEGELGEVIADVIEYQRRSEPSDEQLSRYGLNLQVVSIRALTWAVGAVRGWEESPPEQQQSA